jgi:hypothetical protein
MTQSWPSEEGTDAVCSNSVLEICVGLIFEVDVAVVVCYVPGMSEFKSLDIKVCITIFFSYRMFSSS